MAFTHPPKLIRDNTMKISHSAMIHFPIDRVYDAFLTRMAQLPPWLPSIDKIEVTRVLSLTTHQAEVDYKWHIDTQIIPVILRPFLRSNMNHIRSTTVWCAQKRVVSFEFYHDDYRELFDCKGTFSLVEQSHNSMRIDIDADLYPYPERLAGLPNWVAKKSIPLIEKLIFLDILRPSLMALPEALQAITAISEDTHIIGRSS